MTKGKARNKMMKWFALGFSCRRLVFCYSRHSLHLWIRSGEKQTKHLRCKGGKFILWRHDLP